MEIKKGFKAVFEKKGGRYHIEITRHKDPIMDNILIVNSVGSTKYENTWIIEKDLAEWAGYFESEGYTEIKIIEDVESSKKNNKKKT